MECALPSVPEDSALEGTAVPQPPPRNGCPPVSRKGKRNARKLALQQEEVIRLHQELKREQEEVVRQQAEVVRLKTEMERMREALLPRPADSGGSNMSYGAVGSVFKCPKCHELLRVSTADVCSWMGNLAAKCPACMQDLRINPLPAPAAEQGLVSDGQGQQHGAATVAPTGQ